MVSNQNQKSENSISLKNHYQWNNLDSQEQYLFNNRNRVERERERGKKYEGKSSVISGNDKNFELNSSITRNIDDKFFFPLDLIAVEAARLFPS